MTGRTFDTNYILNSVFEDGDGINFERQYDSNYIFNLIYDPTSPGLRVRNFSGLNSYDLGDFPKTLEPGKFLQVNSGGTAYEFVDITVTGGTGSAYCSAGLLTAPTYTDYNNGTITINENEASLWDNSTFIGFPQKYTIAQKTLTPSTGVTNYIVVSYNNGTPEYQVITDVDLITESNIIPVMTVFRLNSNIHNLNWDAFGTGLANKVNQWIVKNFRLRRESGLGISTISSSAVGSYGDSIKISEGKVWNGGHRQTLPDTTSNTSGTTTFFCYWNGSDWVTSTSPTGFINTQYWDYATNTLKTLGNDKYVNNWVYRGIEDYNHIYILLGEEGQHSNPASALAGKIPVSIPPLISSHALLVGRIIAQESLSSSYDTSSIFETTYGAAGVIRHNDLEGLQGGASGEYYHLTNSELLNVQNLTNVQNYSKEHTGFVDPANVIVNYNATARTITLTGTVTALWQDNVVPSLVDGWVSDPHPSGKTTNQYLYYNGSNFVWSDNMWDFTMLHIAIAVYYGTTVGFRGQRECHGLMQHECHYQDHFNEGTYLVSGGVSRGITLNSTTAANRRPTIDEMVLRDEDLPTTNQAITNYLYAHHYLTGATSAITNVYSVDNADIVKLNGNIPYYNLLNDSNWELKPVPNNGYVSVWRVDIPASSDSDSQKIRSIWVLGQKLDTGGSTVSNAAAIVSQLALDPSTLNLGALATPEFRIGWQYVIRYSNLNWTIVGEQAISGSRSKPVQIQGLAGLTSVAHNTSFEGAGTTSSPLTLTPASSYVLSAASWTALTYTLSTPGVTSDVDVMVNPSGKTDAGLWSAAGIWCTSQATDQLTFSCVTTPSSDINIKVKLL